MHVNSVNNISFKAKQPKNNSKEQYFKYISQFHANDALKMSVGREVEDGKLKATAAVGSVVGLVSACTSIIAATGIPQKLNEAQLGQTNPTKALKSVLNRAKVARVGLYATAGALLVSSIAKSVNQYKANKTANERGFLADKDYNKIKSTKEAYAVTDAINKSHLA